LEPKKNIITEKSTQLYIGWVLFIALLTLLPGSAIPDINWNFLELDKWIHFTVFSVMSFLGIHFFGKYPALSKNKHVTILLSIVIALLYGTSLEFTQSLIPERSFDYADLVANYAGCLFGYVWYRIFSNNL
jgi:glycopeptide antibiotics resistance protein